MKTGLTAAMWISIRLVKRSLQLTMSLSICFPLLSNAQDQRGLVDSRWLEDLRHHADRVSEAPVPPPQYLRRRWRWLASKRRGVDQAKSEAITDTEPTVLEKLQKELLDRLGQASSRPLYESPYTRDQRRAEMDLDTRGTPQLPTYTHEFIPSVYPHKRMTSWDIISDDAGLEVDIGSLTEIEGVEMPDALKCISGQTKTSPSALYYLSIGEKVWAKPQQLDLDCLRDLCLRQGSACFMGVFSTDGWRDTTEPRGIASVSPEQSLVSSSSRAALILSQDDAGNFYLSAPPNIKLSHITSLGVLISAPRTYFSGAWRSVLSLREVNQHPDLQLPESLKREALLLSAMLLKLTPDQSFEEMMYRLSDYFRSFMPGEISEDEGSVYRTLFMSQIGVCRHRSYAFMITARALGIPTRYVTNQVHAFVEVLDPVGRWRRVDLGGEGIAPEDTSLTSKARPQYSPMTDQFYRPDDGLPRPKAYTSLRRQNDEFRTVLGERQTGESIGLAHRQSKADENLNQNEEMSDDPLKSGEVTQAESGEVTQAESGEVTQAESGEVTQSESGEVTQAESGEATQYDGEETTEVKNVGTQIEGRGSAQENPKGVFKLQADQKLSCLTSLENALSPPLEMKRGMLKAFNRLLGLPREDLVAGAATKISLRDPNISRIHRCGFIDLRGRVRPAKILGERSRQRKRLSRSWILAGIKSMADGRALIGWSKLDRRGFFRFKAQVPARVSPGDYQLFVYFPEQLGWSAGWSELEK